MTALDNYPDVFRSVPAPSGKVSRPPCPAAPTLDYERRFRSSGARLLAGIDEVGRGALAGPVSVGIAVVDLQQQKLLADVRDSKLLKVGGPGAAGAAGPRTGASPPPSGMRPRTRSTHSGIIAALRLAGNRAWFAVLAAGVRPGRCAAGRQPQLALAGPAAVLV